MQQQNLQPKQQGTVYFDSDPHGAYVYVDGQLIVDPDTEEPRRTPMKVLLYEGRRDFTITAQGYEDASGYVDVFAGVSVNVYKKLKSGTSEGGWGEPQPQIWLSQTLQTPRPRPNTGIVYVTTYPSGATIQMDGRKVVDLDTRQALKTPVWIESDVGIHEFMFSLQGYCDAYASIQVFPGGKYYIDKYLNIC